MINQVMLRENTAANQSLFSSISPDASADSNKGAGKTTPDTSIFSQYAHIIRRALQMDASNARDIQIGSDLAPQGGYDTAEDINSAALNILALGI